MTATQFTGTRIADCVVFHNHKEAVADFDVI